MAGLKMLSHRYDRAVAKEQLLDADARTDRTDLDGALNYLLVGSDRRPGDTGPDQRSDTILIVHVPEGRREAYLVSIPRDLLVAIPPANGFGGGQDKINAAYEHGGGGEAGARLLSATLNRLTGIRFDGAALIDFSGFRKVIDLLGGVQMCVDTEVRSIHTNRVFPTGCQQMDGAQALDYVRQRYNLPGGDYDRQHHQQQLLRAMLDRAGQSDLRSNPVKLDRVLRAVGGSLTVDTNGVPWRTCSSRCARCRPTGCAASRCPRPRRPSTRSPTWYWTTGATGSSRPSATRGCRTGRRPTRAG
ncbi:hypothetical protein GCM10027614_50180 [Micromonospora vulcania]